MKSLLSFSRGVHPPDHKALTAHLHSRRLPFPQQLVLPLVQYGGAPVTPLVKVGDYVERGDKLADPDAPLSVPVHASASGTVLGFQACPYPDGSIQQALLLKVDPHATQIPRARKVPDWENLTPEELKAAIREAGIVGLGGAAFPTFLKLSPPKDHKIQRLLINGCECEPYLTSDYRNMLERPQHIMLGIRILMKILGVNQAVIGVENNKPEALETLNQILPTDLDIRVQSLEVKYPQGAEKMLIKAVTGHEVPAGALPSAAGAVVHNVATAAMIAEVFETGMPLIERIVTVSGGGINRPGNWIVPLGTPLRELLDACGGLNADNRELVFGGPMMGLSQANLDVPLVKGTGGVLALTEQECKSQVSHPCIQCGRCVEACPMGLNPQLLGSLARKERFMEMTDCHLADCVLCGSCAFVCPSNIPLSQLFALSKNQMRKVQTV